MSYNKRLATFTLNRQNTLVRGQKGLTSFSHRNPANVSALRSFLELSYYQKESRMELVIPLVMNLKFFKNLTEYESREAMQECLKHCSYEFFEAGSFVFHQNERGNKFYIILMGSVKILKTDPGNKKCQVPGYVEVGILKSGESFGERALMLGLPRSASIYTETDCHFASMDYSNYKEVLNAIFQEQFRLLSSLLRNLPTLKDMSKNRLQQISYQFKKKIFKKNELLYHEGEEVKHVYFILNGEVRISQKISVNRKQSILSKNVNEVVQLASLGTGEIFGEEEILDNKEFRTCTCTVFSESTIYYISKENFMKNIMSNEKSETLRQKNKAKLDSRAEMIEKRKHLLKLKMGIIPLKAEENTPQEAHVLRSELRYPYFPHEITTPSANKAKGKPGTSPLQKHSSYRIRPIGVYLGEKIDTPRKIEVKNQNIHTQMMRIQSSTSLRHLRSNIHR